jgi:hypothetical protein
VEAEKALIKQLKACKPLEGIFLEREQWPRTASFLTYFHWMVRREKIDKKFTVRTLKDRSGPSAKVRLVLRSSQSEGGRTTTGWAVLRVK